MYFYKLLLTFISVVNFSPPLKVDVHRDTRSKNTHTHAHAHTHTSVNSYCHLTQRTQISFSSRRSASAGLAVCRLSGNTACSRTALLLRPPEQTSTCSPPDPEESRSCDVRSSRRPPTCKPQKAKSPRTFRSRSRESNTNQNLKLRAEKHCGTVTTAFRYAGAYASTAPKTHRHTIDTVSQSPVRSQEYTRQVTGRISTLPSCTRHIKVSIRVPKAQTTQNKDQVDHE